MVIICAKFANSKFIKSLLPLKDSYVRRRGNSRYLGSQQLMMGAGGRFTLCKANWKNYHIRSRTYNGRTLITRTLDFSPILQGVGISPYRGQPCVDAPAEAEVG